MYQPTVFYVKLQLHFGGDVHDISVPAYGGAEPTVTDLMNVIEHDFRVPRALQNLVFHGQDLHTRFNEPLSRFGIRNGAAIRLVGRMTPPDIIQQINAQYNSNTMTTFHTSEQNLPYYAKPYPYPQNSTIGTQYDPPSSSISNDKNQFLSPPLSTTPTNKIQPPPTPNQEEKPPATPNSSNTK